MNIIKTLADYIQLKTSSFRLSGYSLQWIKWIRTTTTYIQKTVRLK